MSDNEKCEILEAIRPISFPNLGPRVLKLGFICFFSMPESSLKNLIVLTFNSAL